MTVWYRGRLRLGQAAPFLFLAMGIATPSVAQSPPQFCLKPDATAKEAAFAARLSAVAKYAAEISWGATATDGPVTPGQRITLTYSYIPDGTTIHGEGDIGTMDGPSNLHGAFNGAFGGAAAWQARFDQAFAVWSQESNIVFVYEPNDDGAPMPETDVSEGSPGVLGVRGDIRIGGRNVDGAQGGILAYNFLPESGDMVVDTADVAFFTVSSNSFRQFRNTLAHEIGHGLGLLHSCPANQTKLMEPYITNAFDGPRFDDVLGVQELYGDRFAGNGAFSTAAPLGEAAGLALAVETLSLRGPGDLDYFSFTIATGAAVSIAVTPGGAPYLSSNQDMNGSCLAGITFDPRGVLDLGFRVLDDNGAEVAPPVDTAGFGGSETLSALPLGAGTYVLEVFAMNGANGAQPYTLSIDGSGATRVTVTPPVLSGLYEAGSGILEIAMAVSGAAPPVTYAWFKDGAATPLADTGRLWGSATATLRLEPPLASDSGTYRLRVTDPTKTVTESAAVTLTVVNDLPVRPLAVACAALLIGAIRLRFRRAR